MSDAAEDRDEEDEAPVRKKGAAELERERRAEAAKWKPDQFRCRFCPITVIERDRPGHLERCSGKGTRPPGATLDEAFELRPRDGIATTVRRGRPKRPPREKPLITAPVEASLAEVDEEPDAPEPAPRAPDRAAAIAARASKLAIVRDPQPEPKEPPLMAKKDDWITTSAAAELLGVGNSRIAALVQDRRLIGEKRGNGSRAPLFIDPDSVEKYKAERDEQPAAEEPKKPRKKKPKAAKGKARPTEAIRTELAGELREEVRFVIRCVERGYLEGDAAWAELKKLVA